MTEPVVLPYWLAALLAALARERARRRGGAFTNALAFAGGNLWLMIRQRWHRFGYAAVAALVAELARRGVSPYVPRADFDYAIEVGLRMLVLRRLVVERAGRLAGAGDQRALLAYYANSIAHHFEHAPRP